MSGQKLPYGDKELTLRPKGGPSPITPRDHQIAAWDRMTAYYLQQRKNAGLVVVPTGGGKTVLAALWLLQHHIQQGGRVLWLAHRRSLLRQAFSTFSRLANAAAPKPQLGLIAISSDHARWSEVDDTRDVVFASMQTAVLESNSGFVDEFVDSSEHGVFVVVDEAHHAPAPGYKRLLKRLRSKGCRLLGLTATPVRMAQEDEAQLWKLFDDTILFQISRRELTDRGILATPSFETVKTEVNLEREFTPEDYKHLDRYGELGPQVLQRLARHTLRNKLIVEHFQRKQETYGPTIVFAGDTLHAQTLAGEFKKVGVDADYVDYSRKDAQKVIEQFQRQKKPDVLINVEMLTEGFDAPHTRTVFIARPTMSESLVAQMVGRALRGKLSGGNEIAHLVTFLDTWEQFNVVDTAYAAGEGVEAPDQTGTPSARQTITIPIPPQLIQDAYHLLQSNLRGQLTGVYQCLPYGWYMWEEPFDDDLQTRTVTIFENQREGLERLLSSYATPGQIPAEIDEEKARALIRKFFSDVPDPLPRWNDVKALLDARRKECELRSCTLEEKRAFDPMELAKTIQAKNFSVAQRQKFLLDLWKSHPIGPLVYRDNYQAFLEDVSREENILQSPPVEASPDIVKITPKEAPRPWPSGKSYNLVEIRDVVQSNQKHFPRGSPQVNDIQWTSSPLRKWWGFCRYSDKSIGINRVLNSPDIPRFVLEFLMFHELLHADMPSAGHNRDFRARERLFQPSSEALQDAKHRGVKVGAALDFWRVRADMFLDTFQKKWAMAEPGAEISY